MARLEVYTKKLPLGKMLPIFAVLVTGRQGSNATGKTNDQDLRRFRAAGVDVLRLFVVQGCLGLRHSTPLTTTLLS